MRLALLRSYACALTLAALLTGAARAADCDQSQLAAAIDGAGEKLRQFTMATQPAVSDKLRQLKDAKGWSEADHQDLGYAAIEDDRTRSLDATATALLSRLDAMGSDTDEAAMCQRIADAEAASLELLATVRAKSTYMMTRLDQLIAEAKPGPAAVARAPPPTAPPPAPVATVPPSPPPTALPKAAPKADPRWATETKSSTTVPQPGPAPTATPPPQPLPIPQAAPPVGEQDGFSIDEIVAVSSGLFSKASSSLGRVLEHAFAKSGRPTAYILGQEAGGAFIAGLRYGSGTLYLRSGGTLPVYWHGPSIGADIGAQGASIMFLVYRLREPADIFGQLSGVEGSAFVVGGVGMTYLSNKRVDMAPIRTGLGLRVGANLGYLRFTPKQTWNPF